MSKNPFEQARIDQLTSTYGPEEPPRLMLDFGDYLSLLWRLDRCVDMPNRARYYRRCAQSLGDALGFRGRSLFRLVELTEPGNVYRQLPNAPYRATMHLLDAQDRKAAIAQLAALRGDILKMGTFRENWGRTWPGSGILDEEIRERVFAVLFTAFEGQYGNFGRLLLVLDIVLSNLLLGFDPIREIGLRDLISQYDYPDPSDEQVHREYDADTD
jgi:hypothetical protein